MSYPTSMVWGEVPDEYQMADFKRRIIHEMNRMKPPLPPAYKVELTNNIMRSVEGWEWWQRRWFFQYDEWEIRR